MGPMKCEHTPRRLERIVDRGWNYTLRYVLLYMAVSGKHRLLGTCIGAVGIGAGTWIGYRP
ncbi:hypothetical protein MMAGJ_63890 [Mycolicibacterium mageritense]|uniref:Uncharacterized protein n=2 Tax=Mycolicibacterium mageritense TaxID=53462 RepID=A0ABM7I2J4_MYCME|nr:hypothetical protein MMAGJ_63890 [Mycolicibacterium mageritense]CDO26731.1 hypothetical protein BN978_07288 [Mycolicibacterium mageritense DSM 44476 = CIP 104973]